VAGFYQIVVVARMSVGEAGIFGCNQQE
jgi:hypothetical protein